MKIQDEIDQQIRIATPEGDCCIACSLPSDDYGRPTIMRALGTFMVWRQAIVDGFAELVRRRD